MMAKIDRDIIDAEIGARLAMTPAPPRQAKDAFIEKLLALTSLPDGDGMIRVNAADLRAAILAMRVDGEVCPTCGCTNAAFVCSNSFHAPLAMRVDGVEELVERAAIVAWIRKDCVTAWEDRHEAKVLAELATDIENGEHEIMLERITGGGDGR